MSHSIYNFQCRELYLYLYKYLLLKYSFGQKIFILNVTKILI